jgi:hypothetical protein
VPIARPTHTSLFSCAPRHPLPLVARAVRQDEPRPVLEALASGGARARHWCWLLVVLVHRTSSDLDDWNRPIQAFSPLCCKCMFQIFSRFKSMLQWFHRDVAKVDRGYCTCCICCKCFRGMLQAFVQNVLSVLNIRCKRFDLDVCICFTHMLFHMFHLF